ncbi:MAG: hypothetical protein KTR26_06895 [Flammeovirgaceae bacterium]|nr:hypothetical protein [Flammeovirgaceae bacterium]
MKTNLLKLWKSAREASDHLSFAKERFREKNAFETLKSFRISALLSQIFLPLFSILTGTFALATIFNVFFELWLAFVVTIILLALWERVKCLLLLKTFEQFYKSAFKTSVPLFVAALFFATGSIYLSISGAWELSKKMDNTAINVEKSIVHEKDSIITFFDPKIKDAKLAAENYFQQNSYQGVITYSRDGKFAEYYKDLSKRAINFENQKEFAIKTLEFKKQELLKSEKKDYKKFTYSFLGITILVEFLIILANWFLVYFDFSIYSENAIVENALSSKVDISPENLLEIFQAYFLPRIVNSQGQINESFVNTNKKIGFQPPATKSATNQEETRKNQEKGSVADLSDNDIIQDIKAGIRDYRLLMRRHKVNVLTLNKLIEDHG